ncbi:MAG: universal stress protein [Fodinibius sp.]|nr:universal stress protein [Fodinibius sp.]
MAIFNNHIFFPTDFSDNAEQALTFAAEIAYQTGAKLTLFHAKRDPINFSPSAEPSRKNTSKAIEAKFEELLITLKNNKRYQNLTISTILQAGQPAPTLLNQISENQPGLVVMGRQGATASRSTIMGSVTTSIIQKSEVPVLAVPSNSTLDGFKKILFTTDYQNGDLAALTQTVAFARLFDATIDVLHVAEYNNLENDIKFRGFRELVTEHFEYDKITFHLLLEHDFFPGVVEYVSEHPTSLMVLVRYQKSFWERLAQRNHSKEMAFHSTMPLLILTGHKKDSERIIVENTQKAQDAG